MRTASAGLISHLSLNGDGHGGFRFTDLYTITLLDGQVYRWTTHDADLVVGGNTYNRVGQYPSGSQGVPGLKRTRARWVLGTEVESLDITLFIGASSTAISDTRSDGTMTSVLNNGVGGFEYEMRRFNYGRWDGADVKIDRLFFGTSFTDVSLGTTPWFYGKVSNLRGGSETIEMTVKSGKEHLAAMKFPLRLVQPNCPYALFDAGCGVVRASYAIVTDSFGIGDVSGGLDAGETRVSLNDDLFNTFSARPVDFWKLGTIRFNDGPNQGLSRTVVGSAWNGASLFVTMIVGLPNELFGGEAIELTVGCDKTLLMCQSRFANATRFGGAPFVPKPESIR